METDYTVGQYLVDRLEQLGLGHLFSIAGDYSIQWVTRYVEPSRIQVIEEVNELNAGYAADGYARYRGIGALAVTYSAGALCAVNAIAGAYVERVPVVLINGTPSVKKTLTFQQTGFSSHHFISGSQTDAQAFEHLTVAQARIDNPDTAPLLIDLALTECISQRRPVYVELLQDLIDQPCARPVGTLRCARSQSDPDSLQQSLAMIRERLEQAEAPLIWVGVEVGRLGLQRQAAELIRRLKVPFVTELMSKGVLSENDARFAGVFDGQASSAEVKQFVTESDFVLALGVWLTDLNSLGWAPDLGKTAFVSLDTVKYGTFFSAEVSLDHFLEGLLAGPVSRGPDQLRPLPQPRRTDVAVDPITYQGFYDVVAEYVDEHTIVGSDASLNYFGSILLKVGDGGGFVAQASYSSIGYIGPAATGICLAKGEEQKVMVFAGDGGFQMTAQCLSTQTRFGLDPIVFVLNNGVYGVEQWLADASVFTSDAPFYASAVLHPWHYAKLADVFGCAGHRVTTYAELRDAVKAATAHTGSPSLIEVLVDRKSIPDNARWKTD